MDDAILTSKDLQTQPGGSQEEQPASAGFTPPVLPPPAAMRVVHRFVLPHAPRGRSACAFDVEGKAIQVPLVDGVFPFVGVPEIEHDRWRAVLLAAGFEDQSYEVPIGEDEDEDEEFDSDEDASMGAGPNPDDYTVPELRQIADRAGIGVPGGARKDEIFALVLPALTAPAPEQTQGSASLSVPDAGSPPPPPAETEGNTPLSAPDAGGSPPPPPPPTETEDPPAVIYVLRHPDYDPNHPHDGEFKVNVMREGDLEEEVTLSFGPDSTVLTEDAAVMGNLRVQGFDLLDERPKEATAE